MNALLDYYLTQAKISLAEWAQYRLAALLLIAGWMIEPIVNVVVWSTVARVRGGSVGGYTAGDFVAYYLILLLVRHVNMTWSPYVWETRIQHGRLSSLLLQPVHPLHRDLASVLGRKIVGTSVWFPLVAIFVVAFHPTLNPTPWQMLGFAVALVTGFAMHFIIQWVVGLAAFWVTRVTAILELYNTALLLLSGRLVPLSLMPEWTQQIANVLPFRWAFGFQIELLMGRLTWEQVLIGFTMQAIWFTMGVLLLNLVWPSAVRRYSAVGA